MRIAMALCCLLLVSCASSPRAQIVSLTSNHQFNPVEPEAAATIVVVTKATGETETRVWSGLTNTQVRGLLPNQIAAITTYKRNTSGGLSYVAASATAERGEYKVVMDYLNYVVTERIVARKVVGAQRVGVGVRIQADVRTEKAGVDLGGVFSLGVAAQRKLLSGSLRVTTIGISYPGMQAAGFTKNLDESGIQDTLQYVAAIKARIADQNTKLTPYVVAVKSTTPLNQLALRMVE